MILNKFPVFFAMKLFAVLVLLLLAGCLDATAPGAEAPAEQPGEAQAAPQPGMPTECGQSVVWLDDSVEACQLSDPCIASSGSGLVVFADLQQCEDALFARG